MKKISITKKSVMAVALIACVSFAFSAFAQQADKTQEKIRLMVTAVQARDSGDLQASKQAIEELLKITPDDKGVQQLLIDVNADIERQAKGQPLLVSQKAKPVAKAEVADKTVAVDESAAPQNVDEAMEQAVHKQKLQIVAAFDLIDSAYDSMDDSKWDEAADKLAKAEAKLPKTELADEARAEIKKARAAMAKDRANAAIAEKKMSEATAQAAEYAAQEEDVKKGKEFVEEVNDLSNNPYFNSLDEVSPEYVARQKKVKELMKIGRTKYLYGDYQGAQITFREIETLDADNVEAKGYQKLIAKKLENTNLLTYEATRANMINEVNAAWMRPKVYVGNNAETDTVRTESPVEQKLTDIVIPEISFPDPGVPLSQAINTLSILSSEFDKSTDGKKGVNMMLIDGGTEAPKNVILTLRGLSLAQVLDLVTRQVGYQYDIENDIVVVRKGESKTNLDTQDFPVSATAVKRMIGIRGGGAAADSSDPFASAPAAGGSGSEDGDKIKEFLTRAGVEFGPGAALAFDGSNLLVTNTRRNLEKIRTILLRYSEVKQVEIEAKFIEVNQGALKEIAFNYNITNTGVDGSTNTLFATNNRTLSESYSSGSTKSTINITQPVGYTQVNGDSTLFIQTGSETTPVDQNYPTLPSSINLGPENGSTVNATLGFLYGTAFKALITAIEQDNGSDMLSSPKVTVISGDTATITVSQQMRYPESWGDVQSNVGTSGSSDSAGSAGITITPGTPQDFVTADVGVVMEVTPNVEEDGSITLQLNPRVTEFEGFMEYGGYAVGISSGTTVTVPSGFIQPVFSVREIKTRLTVFDGATVVMGGLTREEVRTAHDKVPVLGDIPLIGRLFRSDGEVRQKRNLLIFVTANRISPGGSVGREQFQGTREGAGSVFQNPIIVAPSGAVQRISDSAAE